MKIISHLLSIGLMFTLLGCGTALMTKGTPDPLSSVKVTAQYPLSSKNMPGMSMDELEQIKIGMTYEQVTEIVGSPGEMVAETGNPGDQFYSVTYQFQGEGNILYNTGAQLIFQGGKLTTTTQMGLKKDKHKEIEELK